MAPLLDIASLVASNGGVPVPECPHQLAKTLKYHQPEVCLTKPNRPPEGHIERGSIYETLINGGRGASLVPNTKTVTCPLEVETLEEPGAVRGFNTTWMVENTSTKPVVVAWVVDGVEYSPFHPDMKPIDDPKAILNPGDWTSVPTFESFVYHVREIDEEGAVGDVVLQHRAGMIPIRNTKGYSCGGSTGNKKEEDYSTNAGSDDSSITREDGPGERVATPVENDLDDDIPAAAETENVESQRELMSVSVAEDLEPFSPDTVAAGQPEYGRPEPSSERPCNIIDVGFRNEAGCPLSVYWASGLSDVPESGFACAETYQFHMGTHPAPQDFMWDWNSMTKYEGSFIGHTFVARLQSDPSVIVDSYKLEPTRIVDCPASKKQRSMTTTASKEPTESLEVLGRGTTPPSSIEQIQDLASTSGLMGTTATAAATMGSGGFSGL